MVCRASRLAVVLAICAAFGGWVSAAQSPAPTTDTSRGLSVHYADGRTVTSALRPSSGWWTYNYPKIAGVDTSRNGVPLATMDVRYVVEGRDLVVTVALCYGGATSNPVKVATVRVTPDSAVTVGELRAYGVEPITFSFAAIPRTLAYRPETFSASPQLEVRAEPVGPNTAAYRVVLKNNADLSLVWVSFKGYRGDREVLSGGLRGKRNLPRIAAHSEYSMELGISANGAGNPEGPESWQGLDRIGVSALMWQDGLVEGDASTVERQRRLDNNRDQQLGALLTLLRGARDLPLAALKGEVAPAVGGDADLKAVREDIVGDLEAFERTERSRSGQDFSTWLDRTIAELRQWQARIVFPKS